MRVIRIVHKEVRGEVEAGHAALFRKRAEHFIRQVAVNAAERLRVGMGGDERLFGIFDEIPEARIRKMGAVRDDAKLVHAGKRLDAKGLEPLFRRGLVREAQAVFMVPGDGDKPHTLFEHFIHPFKPAFERYAVLHGEHGGHFPCGAVLFDVRIAEHRGDKVCVLRKLRLIAGGRLFEIFPGADLFLRERVVRRRGDVERKALQQAPALL